MVHPKNHMHNFSKKHVFLIAFSALGTFLYFVIILNNQGTSCFIDCDGESSIINSSDEKFMTYLPHSGFHNQRISLENAIFIAWYLNRTLVIPPIFYFTEILPFGKRPFDKLYSLLSKLTPKKNTYLNCKSNGRKKKCTKITYTLYNWEELMDFRFVKRNVRIIHRADFHYEHLLQSLKISPGDKGQVYNLTEDKSRYMQRYYDSRESTETLGKYRERVDLEDLLDRPEKLLHFGSVFGSSRLVIRLKGSKVFWNNLQREMVPNNPIILEMVDMIIDKIGKENDYVGVHARLGDHFSNHSEKTIQKLIDNLKRDFSGYQINTNQDNDINLDFNKTCYPKFDSKSSIIIYLATDAHRKAACLRPFIEMFPCVYMLEDFRLEPMKNIINPSDGTNMFKHLVPIVDLLVASRSSKLYGTQSSTFSGYAKRLNGIFRERRG